MSTVRSKTPTREVHPLRAVESVDVSEEMGPEELGNPNYFWMCRRYTMHLECGHSEARVGSNFNNLAPEDFMPKRVRCRECPAKQVPVKAKKAPRHDHIAAALVGALLGAAAEAERNQVLDWAAKHTAWIPDDAHRACVYGTVVLTVFDIMMDGRTVKHSEALRECIERWSTNPTDDNRAAVRATSRRLYSAQHADGNDWFAARALVCLGRITNMGARSAQGLIESLTWDRQSRQGFYERLFAARRRLDRAGAVAAASAEVEDTAEVREGVMSAASTKRQDALAEMDRIWSDEYPQVGSHHVPLLFHLLEVFETVAQPVR